MLGATQKLNKELKMKEKWNEADSMTQRSALKNLWAGKSTAAQTRLTLFLH